MSFRFDIGDKEYSLEVSYYSAATPGKTTGPPEDCYPPEDYEIDFEPFVNVDDTEINISFDEFLVLYAQENTEGDQDKALQQIEEQTQTQIVEGANEYEP